MKKERYEWIQSWIEDSNMKDRPRVLLVGDSITNGYQPIVRKSLADVAYVDHVATSMTLDNPAFHGLVHSLVENYGPYAVIHYNQGLHGMHMTGETYEEEIKRDLDAFPKGTKVILTTSTVVYDPGLAKFHDEWKAKLAERNAIVKKIAGERGLPVDDLFPLSLEVPLEHRTQDGYHYDTKGYEILGAQVDAAIRKLL